MRNMYDYRKEFFRRPFWTPSNKRFLTTLWLVFILVVSLALSMMQYVKSLPEIKITRKIKETYITYLSHIYTKNPVPSSPKPAESRAYIENPSAPVAPPIPKKIRKPTPPTPKRAAQPVAKDVRALNKGRIQGSQDLITRAIESAPGLIQPSKSAPVFTPSATYRRKAEEYEIAKAISGAYKGVDYSIPPPEYTDFEIVQGYRDENEIIMALTGKKKYITYCIKRFHRNDPSIRGNIVIKFKIHPDGYVIRNSVRIIETDIRDPRVLRCIKRVISRWKDFPKVAYEQGVYTITQKYIF